MGKPRAFGDVCSAVLTYIYLQGLDWHGPSARDAWGVVDALGDILASREEWNQWGLAPQTKVVLMGHSNGGQGAWYVAGRYPDRVLGGMCIRIWSYIMQLD